MTTVHEVLRYFFVGVIATALVFCLKTPALPWPDRVNGVLSQLGASGFVVLVVVIGSLIYGVHRIAIYPLLYRLLVFTVYGFPANAASWWPYGTVTPQEVDLERRMATASDQTRTRLIGWASEIHLYYIAIEMALFTLLVFPGWPAVHSLRAYAAIVLFALLALVWAWDRQALLVESALASSHQAAHD